MKATGFFVFSSPETSAFSDVFIVVGLDTLSIYLSPVMFFVLTLLGK
jgi:hypothetical protein